MSRGSPGYEKELEVVIPEVIDSGFEPRQHYEAPPSMMKRRWFDGLIAALALTLAGIVLVALGLFFTLTVIGALIGIPLIMIGLGSILGAILMLFGGRRKIAWSFGTFNFPKSRFRV